MTIASQILSWSVTLSLALTSLAFLLTVFRILVGPTLPDRVLGLDMLVSVAIGFMALFAIRSGYSLYIDIAIALGLVGFLATVAFARFIFAKGGDEETVQESVDDGDTPLGMVSRSTGRRR